MIFHLLKTVFGTLFVGVVWILALIFMNDKVTFVFSGILIALLIFRTIKRQVMIRKYAWARWIGAIVLINILLVGAFNNLMMNSLFTTSTGKINAYKGMLAHVFSIDVYAEMKENLVVYPFNTYEIYTKDTKDVEIIKEAISGTGENELFFIPKSLGKLAIIVLDSKEELREVTVGQANYDGVYIASTNTMFVTFEHQKDQQSQIRMIQHEYTHYRMDAFLEYHDIREEMVPRWFTEGIAEFYSQKPLKSLSGMIQPFNELHTQKQWEKAVNEGENPYSQSLFAVQLIVSRVGNDGISSLLLDLKNTESFNESLKKIANLEEADLVKEGKRSIK